MMNNIETTSFYEKESLEQVLIRQIDEKYKGWLRNKIMKWLILKLIPDSFRIQSMEGLIYLQQGAEIGRIQLHYKDISSKGEIKVGWADDQ